MLVDDNGRPRGLVIGPGLFVVLHLRGWARFSGATRGRAVWRVGDYSVLLRSCRDMIVSLLVNAVFGYLLFPMAATFCWRCSEQAFPSRC